MFSTQLINRISNESIAKTLQKAGKYIDKTMSRIRSFNSLERTPVADVFVPTTGDAVSAGVQRLNLQRVNTPQELADIAKSSLSKRKYRIATSGYSSNPEGYQQTTESFLKRLDDLLGKKNTSYIAPPALDDGCIYDMTAKIAGLEEDKLLFITSENYMKYLKPETFPKHINMKKYEKMPIYIMPDIEKYIDGTAQASNVLVCTGGRKVAVDEISRAIKNGNKVIVLINEQLQNVGYNKTEGFVDNAAKYFIEQRQRSGAKHPGVRDMTLEFLKENENRINTLSRVYITDGTAESIESAAKRAAKFLETPTLYDYAEKYGLDISKYSL